MAAFRKSADAAWFNSTYVNANEKGGHSPKSGSSHQRYSRYFSATAREFSGAIINTTSKASYGNLASTYRVAKVSPREEVAKERELQRVDERIWFPPPVKHEPWD